MIKRYHLLLVIVFLGALALTFIKVPIASTQGLTLVASYVDGELPLTDPDSELWQQAIPLEIPLSAQMVSKPFLFDSKIKSVSTRALQDGSQVAILVEWADETRDESTVKIQDFRDSVALQFPLVETLPFFCMGQQGGDVNIWHWKADWQADMVARGDMETNYPDMYVDDYPYAPSSDGNIASAADYTDLNYLPALEAGNLFAAVERSTPVEDLVAGGFGSLTAQEGEAQNVQGYGEWSDGGWKVVFSRELDSPDAGDITFAGGKTYSIAYAVWDGANEERNGQKSTSQWISLKLGSPPKTVLTAVQPASEPPGWLRQNLAFLVLGAGILMIIAVAFIAIKLPE